MVFLLHGHLIFEHASHSRNVFGLLGILLVFTGFIVRVELMLSLLGLDPVLLGILVLLLSEAVGCTGRGE